MCCRALLGEGVETAKLEEAWENQRRNLTGGYSAAGLLESDRAPWTDAAGAALPGAAAGTTHPEQLFRLTASGGVPWVAGGVEGEGWEWRSDWTQDVKAGHTDGDGWRYAPRFNPEVAGWSPQTSMIRLVRRRRWLRLRARPTGQGGTEPAAVASAPAARMAATRSSAEDIRALADDVVTPSGATLQQLLSYSPAQLVEVASELEVVAPHRATVIIPVQQQKYQGVLLLDQGANVDVLSRDLDSRGEWWFVRHQTGRQTVVGFANRTNLQLVPAWGEAPPASTLYTWGRNNHAQLGYAKHDQILNRPRDAGWKIPEGHILTQLSAGKDYGVAVTEDRGAGRDVTQAVWTWGANRAGQLSLQELGDIAGPRPVPALRSIAEARKIQQVACGRSHTLLLQTDGFVMAFGLNDDGQLGIGSTKDSPKPTVVQLGTAVAAQVACGGVHSLVRLKDGRVFGFGKNWCGQLGLNDGRTTCKKSPVPLPNFGPGTGQVPAAIVACGNEFSAVLAEDSGLWMFGYGGQGQLGTGSKENVYGPKRVYLPSSSARAVDVVCGVEYTVVLAQEDCSDGSSRGVMFGSGENGCGQLGLGHCDLVLSFERAALGDHDVVGAMCSKALTVIRTRNSPGLWSLGDVAPPLFQVNLDTASGTSAPGGGSTGSSGGTSSFRQSSMDATSSPRLPVSARVLNVVSEPRVLEPVPVLLLPAGADDDSAGKSLPDHADVLLATHASPHEHMVLAVNSPPPNLAAPAKAPAAVPTPASAVQTPAGGSSNDAMSTSSGLYSGGRSKRSADVERVASAVPTSALAVSTGSAPGGKTVESTVAVNAAYLLPPGWAQARTRDGRQFFVDHVSKATQWEPPEGAIPVSVATQSASTAVDGHEPEVFTAPPEVSKIVVFPCCCM